MIKLYNTSIPNNDW